MEDTFWEQYIREQMRDLHQIEAAIAAGKRFELAQQQLRKNTMSITAAVDLFNRNWYARSLTVRCPSCCWPMRCDFVCNWWFCWLCGATKTSEQIENRSRWRRLIDRLTGDVT